MLADVACLVQGGAGGRGAGYVGAVRNLEIAVGLVVVADER